jgi:hypothetical protein
MSSRRKGGLLGALMINCLMGAGLGLACAIVLFGCDLANVREFFAGEPNPRIAQLIFGLGLAAMFAIGATLTGFIFLAIEPD